MFGIGLPEMLVILAVALLVVGPDKLPGLARSLARTVLELKKTAESMKNEFMADNSLSELKTLKNDLLEFKPNLQEAAKRFQEEILDTENKEIKAPPPYTATADMATGMPMPEHEAASDATAADGVDAAPAGNQPEKPSVQP